MRGYVPRIATDAAALSFERSGNYEEREIIDGTSIDETRTKKNSSNNRILRVNVIFRGRAHKPTSQYHGSRSINLVFTAALHQ